jgi:hypothetical protein
MDQEQPCELLHESTELSYRISRSAANEHQTSALTLKRPGHSHERIEELPMRRSYNLPMQHARFPESIGSFLPPLDIFAGFSVRGTLPWYNTQVAFDKKDFFAVIMQRCGSIASSNFPSLQSGSAARLAIIIENHLYDTRLQNCP